MNYSIEKYILTFKEGKRGGVSFKIDRDKESRTKTPNILYVVKNENEFLYVGEAENSIHVRMTRGFTSNRYYTIKGHARGGYKGYQWIELYKNGTGSVEINVIVLDSIGTKKENKHFRESLEAELCYLIKKDTHQWPIYQNEIHFRNDENASGIVEKIYNEIKNP